MILSSSRVHLFLEIPKSSSSKAGRTDHEDHTTEHSPETPPSFWLAQPPPGVVRRLAITPPRVGPILDEVAHSETIVHSQSDGVGPIGPIVGFSKKCRRNSHWACYSVHTDSTLVRNIIGQFSVITEGALSFLLPATYSHAPRPAAGPRPDASSVLSQPIFYRLPVLSWMVSTLPRRR